MTISKEVAENFQAFSQAWAKDLAHNVDSTKSSSDIFLRSYARITSLEAWRSELLATLLSDDVVSFFLEAQNDALISHVQASCGSWRTALKSLRSCLENTLLMIYYKDHPVELKKWEVGSHRISFTESIKYIEDHPDYSESISRISGIDIIRAEYQKLSRAVHASAREFRMTNEGNAIALWHKDKSHIGKWSSHHGRVLQGVNLLLLVFFRGYLQGAAHPNIRNAVGLAVPASKDSKVRAELGVRIKR